jgi:hypothetical protein
VFPTFQRLPWDRQTLGSTSKTVKSWVIAVGNSREGPAHRIRASASVIHLQSGSRQIAKFPETEFSVLNPFPFRPVTSGWPMRGKRSGLEVEPPDAGGTNRRLLACDSAMRILIRWAAGESGEPPLRKMTELFQARCNLPLRPAACDGRSLARCDGVVKVVSSSMACAVKSVVDTFRDGPFNAPHIPNNAGVEIKARASQHIIFFYCDRWGPV